jgi:hypothetical protein
LEADGNVDQLPKLASELVDRKVDVLVTIWGTAAAVAAKQAPPSIPIVAAAVGDLVATGIVESLARPGGNVTGISTLALTLESKRLELIKELKPMAQRVAVLWDPDNPYSSLAMRTIEASGGPLGVRILRHRVAREADLDQAFHSNRCRPSRRFAGARLSPSGRSTQSDRCLRRHASSSGDLFPGRMGTGWGPNFVRYRLHCSLRARRDVRGQDSQRCETRRPTRRAANNISTGAQPRTCSQSGD